MDDYFEENFSIVEKTYDVIAHAFAPLLNAQNASEKEIAAVDNFLEKIIEKFGRNTPRIADLGCGLGKHGRYCAGLSIDVDGYDISQEMITLATQLNDQEFARKYYKNDNLIIPKMRFIHKANIYDFKPDQKYDGIISCYTFIHLTYVQAAETLRNLRGYLNNGALLFITVYQGIRNGYIEEAIAPQGYHMYYKDYQIDELKTLISQAGYHVLEVSSFVETDPMTSADPEEGPMAIGMLAEFNGDK